MHGLPYNPEWFQQTSIDPLTAWEEYADSLIYWAEDAWDDFRFDEAQAAWKVTLYTGTAALVLTLLLFLNGNPPDPQTVAKKEEKPPVKKKVIPPPKKFEKEEPKPTIPIWPEVKTEIVSKEEKPKRSPKAKFDPFATFGAPELEKKPEPKTTTTIPPFSGFPMPAPTKPQTPVPAPDLFASATITDLLPDSLYSETPRLVVAHSQVVKTQEETFLVADGWKKTSRPAAFPTQPVGLASYFEKKQPVVSTSFEPVSPNKKKLLFSNSGQFPAVTLQTFLPKKITPGVMTSYELVVKNNSKIAQSQIIVQEEISDKNSVIDVVPAGKIVDDLLEWKIDSLQPGQEKRIKITCLPGENLKAITTQSQLKLGYGIASTTNIFVPDVEVSLTLPVKVKATDNFPVKVTIKNNSKRFFNPSDFKLRLAKGILLKNSEDYRQEVTIPSPGKSISLPLTLTAVKPGTGLIEAELDLEDSLMVPVKAHTQIVSKGGSSETKSVPNQAVTKKFSPQLAESGWKVKE